MNQVFKNVLVIFLIAFAACKATAQKFTTHTVKKGESIESIAKQYHISAQTILTYNKEVKKGQTLKERTILVIPATADSSIKPVVIGGENSGGEHNTPTGFTSHKVRKKETLYGIAKRFKISEEEVKRYNRALYSEPLKKNMVLRIPKYKKVKPLENTADPEDYVTYKVAPKETRWSIAHKYSITVDSLLALNPSLSKTSDYLREGQELNLPRIAGSTIENQETQIYTSYTVPPKMNFFRLEQEFGIKSDEIIKLNPEITEKGGLKEGMVIRLPQQKLDAGEVNTDNFNFYEVKPKQTEFSITRKLGISYKDLLALNPDLSEGLKAGMILKLPKDQIGNFEVRNALVLDKLNLVDSINRKNQPKVLFVLPFQLNALDLSDTEAIDKKLAKPSLLKYSLGFYSGALIALDSVAKLGVSVAVKTIDNELDLKKTKALLLQENLADYNAIVGPFDLASVREVAVRAADKNVPVITPIRPNKDVSLKNVFFSYTADPILRKKMLAYVKGTHTEENIIIIADSARAAVSQSLQKNFPDAKIAKVIEEKKNIGVDIDKLKLLLSKEQENWVFVESDNFKLVTSVTSILNSLNNSWLDPENDKEEDKVKLRMFTTFKYNAFDSDVISSTHLSNLNFTFPSIFREPASNSFEKSYRKRFGGEPDRYAVRGFDTTFDLLLKLAYKNDLFQISNLIGETEYTGNKFSYEKDFASGYFNQACYIMSYEDLRLVEIKTMN